MSDRGSARLRRELGCTLVIRLWVKTAVSIPDDVLDHAEQLARERNASRSELYADALRLLVASDARVTDRLDALYGDAGSRVGDGSSATGVNGLVDGA